ncbi:MAG: response regulator [Desulfosarcina sp.]|nr:response regulator [Desulfobacterales bacterium]
MKDTQSIKKVINAGNEGFAGTLSNIALTDLIQICCMACSDMAIRVKNGSEYGIIYIRDGRIVHSTCLESVGEAAFYKILSWKGGSFEAIAEKFVPKISIDQNYQFLLIEAARLADEKEKANSNTGITSEDECLKVLIVDDSTMMRRVLADLISSDKRIKVAGTAENGEEALSKIKELKPDIITLDVNMPVMDGNTALKHIMIQAPCPVLIISSPGEDSYRAIIDFLRLGAVDFIKKPDKKEDMSNYRAALVEKIFTAVMAKMDNFKRVKLPGIIKNKGSQAVGSRCESLVIINSGMGGYAELIRMAPLLRPDNKTCLVLFQDMPDEFIKPVSDYLDQRSSFNFMPLQDGAVPLNGFCYISPNRYIARYNHDNTNSTDAGSINIEPQFMFDGDRGSMFHLFLNSVADSFPGKALVLLLSGADVGDPAGLRNIRKKGGKVLIQQIDTCLVPHPLKIIQEEELADHEVSPDGFLEYIGSAIPGR